MSKYYLQTVRSLSLDVDEAWTKIRSGENMEEWHPVVKSTEIVGNQRVRHISVGILKETILVTDDTTRTFKYSIDEQEYYPVQNIIGTIKIVEGKENTLMFWDVEFTLEYEDQLEEVTEIFYELADQVSAKL